MNGKPICLPGLMYRCHCGERNWRDGRGVHMSIAVAVHTPDGQKCPIYRVEIPSRHIKMDERAWGQIEAQIRDAVRLMKEESQAKGKPR